MNRAISILMPAYNESGNIVRAVAGVQEAASLAGLEEYEIIVVDDGSTDSTYLTARGIEQYDPFVSVGRHPVNRGLRAAYETGLARARYPFVAWFPGDGEMATDSIAAILRAIGTADLVIPYHGTPERRPWFRRLLTWGSTTQLNVLLGRRLNYYQGCAVYPTDIARRLPRTEPGFFVFAEMLSWALEEGLSYVEVPLEHVERTSGVSKAVSWRAIWAAQKLIVRLAFRIHAVRMAKAASSALRGTG